jgi:hypothetical protein
VSTAKATREPVESEPDITQRVAFDVLSARRRRHVLHYLLQVDRTVELRELSEQLAAWENGVPPVDVTYDQRMRVYTSLRQLHLPKLDTEGIVEFDANRGTVVLTEEAAELEVYLEVVPHEEIPWSKYYAGLGSLSAMSVASAGLGVVPLTWIPGLWLAGIITLLFLGSALYHCHYDTNHRLGASEEPPT